MSASDAVPIELTESPGFLGVLSSSESSQFAEGFSGSKPNAEFRSKLRELSAVPKAVAQPTGPESRFHETLSGAIGGVLRSVGIGEDHAPGSVMDPTYAEKDKAYQVTEGLGILGQAVPLMPTVGKGVAKAASAYGEVLEAGADKAARYRSMFPGQRGIIKKPGGNWLPDSVEDKVSKLKLSESENPDSAAAAMNQFLSRQTTRYIRNEMGTERDSIRLGVDTWDKEKTGLVENYQQRIDAAIARRDSLAASKDAPTEALTKSNVRIRELRQQLAGVKADTGLHGSASLRPGYLDRTTQGFPAGPVAESETGKLWENASDPWIHTGERGGAPSSEFKNNAGYIDALPKDAKFHYPVSDTESLGLPHLKDELLNAMSPASDLPKHLQIKPQDLAKYSMSQASRHVAKIDAWRAANKKTADLSETLKADVHKDYPEEGYRWIRLDKPGQFKAESAAMGHSVEGYEPTGSRAYGLGGWEAIESGKAKVYSLRDTTTGKSLATIEVESGIPSVVPEAMAKIRDKLPEGLTDGQPEELMAYISAHHPEAVTAPKTSITQIKGPHNKPPSAEAIRYVQDFIKSGEWTSVGDLKGLGLVELKADNTAERRILGAATKYVTDEVAAPIFKQAAALKPKVVKLEDKTEHRVFGQLHREDGPAIEYVDGTKMWYKNGQLHREDGPAIERVDRTKIWYKNGKYESPPKDPRLLFGAGGIAGGLGFTGDADRGIIRKQELEFQRALKRAGNGS